MRHRRGLMLVYVLMLMSLLVVLSGTLVASVRSNLNLTWQYCRKNAALYAAEAGVARCMAVMELDATWTAGFDREPLEGSRGTYSCTFHTSSATPGPDESVNNLEGVKWAASYRGPQSVPPRSALLVVTGEVDGVRKSVEVMVQPGGGANVDAAALVSNRIKMSGNVYVDGQKTLAGAEKVQGDIHSNLISDEADIVTYKKNPDESNRIYVTGMVSSSAVSEGAIRLETDGNDKALPQTNAPVKPMPFVDIEATIAAKSDKPELKTYRNKIDQIECRPGDYYIDGDLELGVGGSRKEDLVLNDTRLFVKGKLTINGRLMGTGSVVVGKETTLIGSTSITTSDKDRFVALFSKGRVHLKGNTETIATDPADRESKGGRCGSRGCGGGGGYSNRDPKPERSYEESVEASGRAGFVGLVYTNGGILAEQNVSVYGSIVVRDDGTQQPETLDHNSDNPNSSRSGPTTIYPGDLQMEEGAVLVYVQEFFQQSEVFHDLCGLGVTSWLEH